MEYSFGIITYNHEKFVLETLESIKYQIEKYGKDLNGNPIDIFLYINDDCSSDRTIELVKKWTEKYKSLFKDIKVFESEVNHGTVYGYKNLLKAINTKYFKVIAGDDLFSCDDVFENLKTLKNADDATAYFPLILFTNDVSNNWKIDIDYDLLNKNLYYGHKKRSNRYDIRHQEKGGYFNTPSFFPTRNLINQKCLDYLDGIKLFEDDPTWHMILKTNPSININFENRVKVLYRNHDKAVSNGSESNSAYKVFMKDWILIKTRFANEEKNIFTKIYLKSHIHDLKNKDKGIVKRITLYKIFFKLEKLKMDFSTKKYYNESYNKYLADIMKSNKEYYVMIKQNTEDFYKEFYGE